MPTYISLINWTEKGAASFKETVDRAEAANALAASFGGSLKEIYWTVGPYDIVAVTEAPDDESASAFSLKLGQQSTVFKNAPKGVLFPGDQGAPFGANFPDKNDWAPRIGFAWDPTGNGKMSVRGGVGVFFDILKGEDNLQFNGQAPFFGFADLFFDDLSANPTREINYFSQPFVAAGIPNSFPSRPPAPDIDFGASGFLPVGGGGVYYVDPKLRTPYTYQYNLAIQREITRNIIVEAAYVGSSSHKLTSLVDANPFILGTTHRVFNAQPGNDDASFSYLYEFRNVGTGSFNSLELSLQKRLSETRFFGTTYFTLAYTLGHSIDTSSGFRQRNSVVPAYNSQQFRADSDFDLRQRFTFSGGWDLPFDRAWSSGPKRLTQGWSLYPIVTKRTGFPLDVYAGLSASRTATGPTAAGDRQLVRANLVGGGVTVPAGFGTAQVLVTGLAQSVGVTLTATQGHATLTSTVRVIGPSEQPAIASLTPAAPTMNEWGTVALTVALDIPAPAGGASSANSGRNSSPAWCVTPMTAASAFSRLPTPTRRCRRCWPKR